MFEVLPAGVPWGGLFTALGSVLLGSLGVPLPTLPLIIFAGSLLAFSLAPLGIEVGAAAVAAGTCFALIGDLIWFTVGRRLGPRILSIVCRLSLSRDTCVRNTASLFAQRGLNLLLFSRFLPGLSMVTSPLAGASGVPMERFALFDALGAALWIAVGLAIGFVFAAQIAMVMLVLRLIGMDVGGAAVTLLVVYIGYKWTRRKLLMRRLRMARISVEELNGLISAGKAPVIIDVRSELEQNTDPFLIPGALVLRQAELEGAMARLPPGHPTIVYCTCPNEVSAAVMVRRLKKIGLTNIHPLKGGMNAWRAAGLPVAPYMTLTAETVA